MVDVSGFTSGIKRMFTGGDKTSASGTPSTSTSIRKPHPEMSTPEGLSKRSNGGSESGSDLSTSGNSRPRAKISGFKVGHNRPHLSTGGSPNGPNGPDAATMDSIRRQEQSNINQNALAEMTIKMQEATARREALKAMAEAEAKATKDMAAKPGSLIS